MVYSVWIHGHCMWWGEGCLVCYAWDFYRKLNDLKMLAKWVHSVLAISSSEPALSPAHQPALGKVWPTMLKEWGPVQALVWRPGSHLLWWTSLHPGPSTVVAAAQMLSQGSLCGWVPPGATVLLVTVKSQWLLFLLASLRWGGGDRKLATWHNGLSVSFSPIMWLWKCPTQSGLGN